MQYKYVNELSIDEKHTLKECLKNHKNSRTRQRAHGVLLSSRKYTIDQIADLYELDRDTVSSWLTEWDKVGITALFDNDRSGRPRKLTDEEMTKLIEELKNEPRSVKRLIAITDERFGKTVSTETIKRALRKLGQKWKRIKATVKNDKDSAEYKGAVIKLLTLQEQQRTGEIALYYFDATGFSLMPYIPYAWQKSGQTIEIQSSRSSRINVLGFMDLQCNITPYTINGKVDSEVVINCFDDFVGGIGQQETWVVLDNASIHTSALFKAKIQAWALKGLNLFYLPPRSPELNKIEILWRFMKYQWINLNAYLNINTLKKEIDYLLCNIGKEYRITFV